MSLELHDNIATLAGVVTVDDVEPLVAWFRTTPDPQIDLRECNHLHTGAVQAMLVFRPKITAAPVDGFLATRVLPLLIESGGSPERPGGKPP